MLAVATVASRARPTMAARVAVPSAVSAARVPLRTNFNLHEYQSKALMDKFGVNTQRWRLAETPAQAEAAARDLKAKEYVVKAQVHAGGRGRGTFTNGFEGGVHLTTDASKVAGLAKNMLGNRLVTKQTPPAGVMVNKVMVCESLNLDRELYLAILMDRTFNGPVIVASQRGGMNIEEVAETEPEAIFNEPVDIVKGLQTEQTARLAEKLGFKTPSGVKKVSEQIAALYKLFLATDATQVEINPLAECKPDGDVYAVDAKISFDDNAAFRQEEIFAQRDTAEEDPREVEAAKANLNYIAMDGNIGCLVNGAGLAMATMDIIQLKGGKPANFLDVGGNATQATVEASFKLITSDASVKAILVNIFGGIVDCAVIANGVVAAAKSVGLHLPLIVRLSGTNSDAARKIIAECGLDIISAENLDEAAEKAVASLKK